MAIFVNYQRLVDGWPTGESREAGWVRLATAETHDYEPPKVWAERLADVYEQSSMGMTPMLGETAVKAVAIMRLNEQLEPMHTMRLPDTVGPMQLGFFAQTDPGLQQQLKPEEVLGLDKVH